MQKAVWKLSIFPFLPLFSLCICLYIFQSIYPWFCLPAFCWFYGFVPRENTQPWEAHSFTLMCRGNFVTVPTFPFPIEWNWLEEKDSALAICYRDVKRRRKKENRRCWDKQTRCAICYESLACSHLCGARQISDTSHQKTAIVQILKIKTATFFWTKRDQGQKVQLRIGSQLDRFEFQEWNMDNHDRLVRQIFSILPEEWRKEFLDSYMKDYELCHVSWKRCINLLCPYRTQSSFNDQNVAFKPWQRPRNRSSASGINKSMSYYANSTIQLRHVEHLVATGNRPSIKDVV